MSRWLEAQQQKERGSRKLAVASRLTTQEASLQNIHVHDAQSNSVEVPAIIQSAGTEAIPEVLSQRNFNSEVCEHQQNNFMFKFEFEKFITLLID
jgi:hypothetical protein